MGNKVNFLGYSINSKLPAYPLSNIKVVNTINPHSYCVAKRDPEFKTALRESDWLVPDGFGIVLAINILYRKKIARITGSDIHVHLLSLAVKNSLSVFYLGSSEDTLSKILQNIKKDFPSLRCSSYSPPFKTSFNKMDSSLMIDAVNNFKTDILFVGMTAPKQEKWVHQNKDHIDARVICSIGAVFDFYAGTAKRAPVWMQKTGLEWLHRSFINPTRLGKRNMRSNPEFLRDVIKVKLKGKS